MPQSTRQRPMGEDAIVLSFYDAIIRQSDVDILRGPEWLTDTLIGFYFEYLSNVAYKGENRLLFIGPEVTQCLKVSEWQDIGVFLHPLEAEKRIFIFLPVNDCTRVESPGGSHWSLLVYCKNEDTFFHYDSSSGTNYTHAHQLAMKLSKFLSPEEAAFVQPDTLQQKNGYDCGIHVLCNVDNIAEHCAKYNRVEGAGQCRQSQVDKKRMEVMQLIFQLKEEKELPTLEFTFIFDADCTCTLFGAMRPLDSASNNTIMLSTATEASIAIRK